VRRLFASIERALDAEGGQSPETISALRKYWAITITSDGNALWNKWDNPARRRKR
jgi:hypothetical protein